MLSYKRSARIRELMIEEISDIIRTELKDPRIGFVTVVDVDLPENLRHANIYISPMGTPEEKQRTVDGVQSAAPFIRRQLGQRMKIKFLPELTIKWDHTAEHSDKINKIIHRIHEEENKSSKTGGEE